MADNEVHIEISGPVGCGKSAVYHEIVVALQAAGLTVIHDDPAEWRTEAGHRAYVGPPDTDIIVRMKEIVKT